MLVESPPDHHLAIHLGQTIVVGPCVPGRAFGRLPGWVEVLHGDIGGKELFVFPNSGGLLYQRHNTDLPSYVLSTHRGIKAMNVPYQRLFCRQIV